MIRDIFNLSIELSAVNVMLMDQRDRMFVVTEFYEEITAEIERELLSLPNDEHDFMDDMTLVLKKREELLKEDGLSMGKPSFFLFYLDDFRTRRECCAGAAWLDVFESPSLGDSYRDKCVEFFQSAHAVLTPEITDDEWLDEWDSKTLLFLQDQIHRFASYLVALAEMLALKHGEKLPQTQSRINGLQLTRGMRGRAIVEMPSGRTIRLAPQPAKLVSLLLAATGYKLSMEDLGEGLRSGNPLEDSAIRSNIARANAEMFAQESKYEITNKLGTVSLLKLG